jgi:antitoxin CptB|tara:strand:- start:282 stop:539 length:258 start_codon:yes stop_codon:yes gene_type:complete
VSNKDFIKKLLFRSNHRGTKEMDLVLGGFFQKYCFELSDSELSEFEKILEMNDKLLTDYFVMNVMDTKLDNSNLAQKIKIYLNRE